MKSVRNVFFATGVLLFSGSAFACKYKYVPIRGADNCPNGVYACNPNTGNNDIVMGCPGYPELPDDVKEQIVRKALKRPLRTARRDSCASVTNEYARQSCALQTLDQYYESMGCKADPHDAPGYGYYCQGRYVHVNH